VTCRLCAVNSSVIDQQAHTHTHTVQTSHEYRHFICCLTHPQFNPVTTLLLLGNFRFVFNLPFAGFLSKILSELC